jgi:hypothetical protein
MSYVQRGKARNVYIRQNEGSLMDVEHAEMVEKQLDAMIQRRARKGDVDPDDRSRYRGGGRRMRPSGQDKEE